MVLLTIIEKDDLVLLSAFNDLKDLVKVVSVDNEMFEYTYISVKNKVIYIANIDEIKTVYKKNKGE